MDAGEISEQQADKTRCERCGDEEVEWVIFPPNGGYSMRIGTHCNNELPERWKRERAEIGDFDANGKWIPPW